MGHAALYHTAPHQKKIECNIKEIHKKLRLLSFMNRASRNHIFAVLLQILFGKLANYIWLASTSQKLCFAIIFTFHGTSFNGNETIVLVNEPNGFVNISYINMDTSCMYLTTFLRHTFIKI